MQSGEAGTDDVRQGDPGTGERTLRFPLEETAESLDRRLGLYLSEQQQRGFGGVLFLVTMLATAALVWAAGSRLRRGWD